MKLSELINILNEYKEKYGNIIVLIDEPDYFCDSSSRELEKDDIILGADHTYVYV